MDSDIAEALARVVARLPGDGELRHGQVEMAEAVGRAIEEKRPLVVQAGTGVGKSLGYLVPCVVLGVKTVVATATTVVRVAASESVRRFRAAKVTAKR